MQFPDPPRRKPPESIVPMINVVFLLLIFFLMTAQIAPPDPFEINPPDSAQAGDPAEGGQVTCFVRRRRVGSGIANIVTESCRGTRPSMLLANCRGGRKFSPFRLH